MQAPASFGECDILVQIRGVVNSQTQDAPKDRVV